MENLKIVSFVGITPYHFGDSFEKVKTESSENYKLFNDNSGKRMVDGIYSLRFESDKLIEISLLPSDSVFFDSMQVFTADFHESLKSRYEYVYKFGFLIFDDLGLALSGFEEKEETKTVTLFQKGGWDNILNL